MKTICTLLVAVVAVLINGTTQAQTTYTINTSRTWSNNNNEAIPSTCVNCTINIASGATLTIDQNLTLRNCSFNGGTVSMTNKTMTLQTVNSNGTTYFTGTTLLVYGSSVITGSAPIVMTNSTFKFYNSAKFNPQQLLDLTNSKIFFYDNSYLLSTGGPINLKSNSMLVAGDGSLSSAAYLYINGPTLNVYDASSVMLGNNNNYYFNWNAYFAGSTNTWYNTKVNTLNCGSGYPNSCRMPYVYGPSTINGSGVSGVYTLPIVMSEFAATLLNNHTVSLTWTTLQESNASHFVIERSTDGLQWNAAGTVTAKGNTAMASKYSFVDVNPADGKNFYRLKLVDLDGTYEYSIVKMVQHTASQNISVYPNPAQTFVNVSVPKSNTAATVRLLNTTGQVLQERSVTGGIVSLPVQNYTAGTYFIQVVKADGFKQNSLVLIGK